MYIVKVALKNFKNFAEPVAFAFGDMTLIKGSNGSGKSTLALESVLFALYGYTPKDSLAKLPNKQSNIKTCLVTVELEHQGKTYIVQREYPTRVVIFEDGVEISKTWSSSESQKYINNLFGDVQYFKRFRVVEAHDKDAGILELGPSALKKILFSVSEDLFNKVKNNLLELKRERETYNRNKIPSYPYCPSNKRLESLIKGEKELIERTNKLDKEISELYYNKISPMTSAKNNLSSQMNMHEANNTKMRENPNCYVCNQVVPEDVQKRILTETELKISELGDQFKNKTIEVEGLNKLWEDQKMLQQSLRERQRKVHDLVTKLNTKMGFKEYRFCDKDVLVVKKASEELDKLSSYYLAESVKMLEPIINSILEKIDFQVKFTIDEKGKFSIILTKNEIEYTYSDLSEGQKLILSIAFKLALLMERAEEGIVIADEGFSSLDRENLMHVITIFQNLPFQLFFVLHRADNIPENIKVIDLNEGEK